MPRGRGQSNEMFSDFQNHVVGVPQIAPFFGVGRSNMIFDGPGENEDFGAQQISGDPADRYKFRTAPLRNIALAARVLPQRRVHALEDAIRHHLDAVRSAPLQPEEGRHRQGSDAAQMGPPSSRARSLDPELAGGIQLTPIAARDLTQFVKTGLLDPRARKRISATWSQSVPSRLPALTFEACNMQAATASKKLQALGLSPKPPGLSL